MGIFGDLKMMVDTVKDCVDMGIEGMKVCDQMEKLIEEARKHIYDDEFLSKENIQSIKEYDKAKKEYDTKVSKVSSDESLKLNENVEKKQLACLKSFQSNKKFSKEFRDSCQKTIKAYAEANDDDKLFDSIEKNMLKNYKFDSEEEKEQVHQIFQMSKRNGEACDEMIRLIEEARKHKSEADFLTAADKKAIAAYDEAKEAYDKNKSSKKTTDLNEAMEAKETACMDVFQKNTNFSQKFRNSCKAAKKLYKEANDAIEALAKYQ